MSVTATEWVDHEDPKKFSIWAAQGEPVAWRDAAEPFVSVVDLVEEGEITGIHWSDKFGLWLHDEGGTPIYCASTMTFEQIGKLHHAATAHPAPASAGVTVKPLVDAGDVKLDWFMRIMAQVKRSDAGDYRWNWIMAFCSDRGNENDTFNIAKDRNLIWVSHNSDTDHSECGITTEGEAYAAALSQPAQDK